MGKERSCVIEPVSKKNETSMLIQFENGHLKENSAEKITFFPTKNNSKNINGATVIAGDNIFHGTLNTNFHTQLDDIYICVRKKDSNKVKVLKADHVRLSNEIYYKKKEKMKQLSKNDQMQILMKQFGGRKASRIYANRANLQINVEAVKDQLDSTIVESNFEDILEPKDSSSENLSKICPPFNKNASELGDVYNINDIISAEMLDRLDEDSKAVFSTDIKNLPITSEYLLKKIKSFRNSQNSRNLHNIKLVIYMDALLNLIRSDPKTELKNIELSAITEKVENDIKHRFIDRTSTNQKKTAYTTEKAICYFLVMDLILSKYELDVDVISQELGISKQKLLKLSNFVHASTKPRSSVLALRLPSSFKSTISNKPSKFKKKS